MENTDYLQPGFDPTTLRVADLRRIFVFHEVEYPSSAKKADLVQLFRDNITPHSDELLKKVQNIEPNSAGIVDAPPPTGTTRQRRTRSTSPAKSTTRKSAPSSSPKKSPTKSKKSNAVKDEEVEQQQSEEKKPEPSTKLNFDEAKLQPPPSETDETKKNVKKSTSPSPRKSGRKTLSKPFIEPSKEEEKEVVTKVEENTSTPSVIKVGSGSKKSDTSTEFKKTPKKAELKSDEMDVDEEDDDTSPFSDKNVFQTGNTPATGNKKASSRKSTTGASPAKKRSLPKEDNTAPESKRRSKNLSSTPQQQTRKSTAGDTPGTALRHFSSFPSTPDDDDENKSKQDNFITPEQQLQQQRLSRQSNLAATVQPSATTQNSTPPTFQDNTYKPATEAVNKRLSFMPDLSDLKMSNQFSQQLSANKKKQESSPKTFSKVEKQPEPVAVETGQEKPPSNNDDEVKKLEEEVDNEQEKEDEEQRIRTATSERSWSFYAERVFGLFVISLLCGYVTWWCQERFNVGYCNVGFISDDSSLEDEYYNDKNPLELLNDYLQPKCVPCPPHATCYPNFKAICDEDFKYRENVFSFSGFLPIAPSCLPDTEKQQRIMALSNRAKQILRQRNADVECGNIEATTAAIEEDDLRDLLYKDKKGEISDEEWNDLWRHAIKDLDNEDDIIVQRIHKSVKGYAQPGEPAPDLVTKTKVIQSTSLANISFTCRVRRTIRGSLERNRREIQLVLGLFIVSILTRFWYKNQQEHNSQINQLAKEMISQLQQQQKSSEEDTKGLIPRHLAAAHLRDSNLLDLKGKRKEKVWKDVEKVVETNSNVRVRQIEVHGEIMKVWEWVSPTSTSNNN